MTQSNAAWTPVTDLARLDSLRYSPVKVLLACWYDGGTLVTQAGYYGDGDFKSWEGHALADDMRPTHWQWVPEPPTEEEMLKVCLRGVIAR